MSAAYVLLRFWQAPLRLWIGQRFRVTTPYSGQGWCARNPPCQQPAAVRFWQALTNLCCFVLLDFVLFVAWSRLVLMGPLEKVSPTKRPLLFQCWKQICSFSDEVREKPVDTLRRNYEQGYEGEQLSSTICVSTPWIYFVRHSWTNVRFFCSLSRKVEDGWEQMLANVHRLCSCSIWVQEPQQNRWNQFGLQWCASFPFLFAEPVNCIYCKEWYINSKSLLMTWHSLVFYHKF